MIIKRGIYDGYNTPARKDYDKKRVKATLTFNLDDPEDKDKHTYATNAVGLYLCVWEINERLISLQDQNDLTKREEEIVSDLCDIIESRKLMQLLD